MLMAAYSTLLGLGLALSSPWWLLRMATTSRYREGLPERLGRVPLRLRLATEGRRVVWLHAVSVGEVLAVAGLVHDLEAALNRPEAGLNRSETGLNRPQAGPYQPTARPATLQDAPWIVVVSTTTRTGQALARERFGADRVFYLPLDFRWAVQAFLRGLRPALLVLAESELWPRLLDECAWARIPVAVVNARVSDRSFRRAGRVRGVWRHVLGKVTLFLAQSPEDARRLHALGAPDAAVRLSGNLKYDPCTVRTGPVVNLLRGALAGRPVIVAGSTVEGEEDLLLQACEQVWRVVPSALLVLAPRHPERFAAVLGAARYVRVGKVSALRPENVAELLGLPEALGICLQVLVLDTLGDLAAVYGLATVAFVGGSLVARGGHNPLEPARLGVPVVMGPSFANFRHVVQTMEAAGGIRIVENGEKLASTLIELLTKPEAAHSVGERGQTVFAREGGATTRSIQMLMPLIYASDHAHVRTNDRPPGSRPSIGAPRPSLPEEVPA